MDESLLQMGRKNTALLDTHEVVAERKKSTRKKARISVVSIVFLCSILGNIVAVYVHRDLWFNFVYYETLNFTHLKTTLSSTLFGHEEAVKVLVAELTNYQTDESQVSRPRIISVHGSSGTGKTKLTDHLLDFFPDGCARKFIVPLHFPGYYQTPVDFQSISSFALNRCSMSLVIFEEMDFASYWLINVLNVFLKGVNERKLVVLFTSTAGVNIVVDEVVKVMKSNGSRRDFSQNEASGLLRKLLLYSQRWENNLWVELLQRYTKEVVFITFLPLDKEHVKQCITTQIEEFGVLNEDVVECILEKVSVFNGTSLVVNGCKNIDAFVKYYYDG